ncbi:hypothetical protein OHA18_37820 [Kribbella sp. NBC_00709]|uniref:CARDB domain-containing protein n=1 Tax=Kribbella sp. NBC_00709 TaxID=2975972 RepID=UPI002E28C94F|nr:CARDB domain-containing protein [Kribbella sp. NBC_00709]
MLLAVVGSVAGTLVTAALDGSPTTKLVGAALGAAIPPVIAVAGPFSRLRLAGGTAVTVLALLFTYAGFTVPQTALGKETTFPVPVADYTPNSPTPPPPPTASGTVGHCEGQLCILVEPAQVRCSGDHCDSAVQVTSGGRTRLRLGSIEFKGDIADRFSQTGNCEKEVLIKLEKCSISIQIAPGPAGTAQMRIHQNLKGPASVVTLEADELAPSPVITGSLPDLTLSADPQCSVVPGGQTSRADGLTLFVGVRNEGEGQVDSLVPFRLTSNTGLRGSGRTALDSEGLTAMQVDLGSSDYEKSHLFTVTVDPNNQIPEQDETNNTLRLKVSLPTRPDQAQDVRCAVIG